MLLNIINMIMSGIFYRTYAWGASKYGAPVEVENRSGKGVSDQHVTE